MSKKVIFRTTVTDFLLLPSSQLAGQAGVLQTRVLLLISQMALLPGEWSTSQPFRDNARSIKLWLTATPTTIYVDHVQYSLDAGQTWQNP
jgi:hypothetical protein